MKAIMLMFDSLNRHMLPPYGPTWLHAPNFARLARRSVTFDKSYVCSMPCMPARRDLHTGRPNFLHRGWGPLEPFDDSVPAMLNGQGVSTHLITDHYHYFQAGGANYHAQYGSWQFFRGQETDPWMGQAAKPEIPPTLNRKGGAAISNNWINRPFMEREEDQPQARTMEAGLDFIRRNHEQDRWFLQIETFDPHEPYISPRKYNDLYAAHYQNYRGLHFDWPSYGKITETPEEVEHLRHEYAALVSMCDAKLGDLLDAMDKFDMWKDTMLIVWTDHGFLLGEHDSWAKNVMPMYDEIAHTPFFIWDPRSGKQDEHRRALVQPAIDLGPTLLDYFGLPMTADMLGKPLGDVIVSDAPVRDAAIFGQYGTQINVTDGRYVYMRSAAHESNQPLFNYTLMPAHGNRMFSVRELAGVTELAPPWSFTKGCQTLKIPDNVGWFKQKWPTLLYDLQTDPQQNRPIEDQSLEQTMIDHMVGLMRACDAPTEQYERMGLPSH